VTAILKPGTGSIVVNRKPFVEYFPEIQWRETILQPFLLTERLGVYDVYLRAAGGGKGSQAESARMAISRALVLRDPR
jgi:small subunit ribosomal protein S9